jgi:predicted transcriptional regulator
MSTKEKILDFIEKYREQHGCLPLQTDIANGLGVTRQNIRYHFNMMREELKDYPEYMKRYFSND